MYSKNKEFPNNSISTYLVVIPRCEVDAGPRNRVALLLKNKIDKYTKRNT